MFVCKFCGYEQDSGTFCNECGTSQESSSRIRKANAIAVSCWLVPLVGITIASLIDSVISGYLVLGSLALGIIAISKTWPIRRYKLIYRMNAIAGILIMVAIAVVIIVANILGILIVFFIPKT